MNIFQYLILLGIIIIVFNYIWNWLIVLPVGLLFTAIKFDSGIALLKILGAYFMVSLIALGTMFALEGVEHGIGRISFPLLGIFVVFIVFTKQYYEQEKKMVMEDPDILSAVEIEREMRKNYRIMFGAPLFFFLALLIPELSENFINEWFFYAISWIYNFPVIGWLFAIWSIFYMANILFYGLSAIASLKGTVKQGLVKVKDIKVKWVWIVIFSLLAIVLLFTIRNWATKANQCYSVHSMGDGFCGDCDFQDYGKYIRNNHIFLDDDFGLNYCEMNYWDCSDFCTQKDAQAIYDDCLDVGAGDVNNIDRDSNGIACESLP